MARTSLLMGGSIAAILVGVLAPGAAYAQPASPPAAEGVGGGNLISEVVVTARRREENVQDVPAAVTAISGETLEAQQIRTPTDLQATTPSLAIGGANSNFSRTMGNYSIRGIGQGLFGGSSVTSYFAEAPFGPTGPAMPFFDIGSVQVLKGPQGTLFGRATAGGAVLVGPAPPTLDAFYGSVGTTVGNYGRLNFDAMLNVPIAEGAGALRFAYNRTHMDGYTDNLSTGQTQDEDNSQSFRVSLLIQPNEYVRNYTVYNLLDYRGNTAARVTIAANLGLANLNRNAAAFATVCGQAVTFGFSTNVATCQAERVQILANIRQELRAEVDRTTGASDGPRTNTSGPAYANFEEIRMHTLVNDLRLSLPERNDIRIGFRDILSLQLGRGVVSGNFSGTSYDLNASAFSVSGGLPGTGLSQAQWIDGRAVADPGKYVQLITNEIQMNGSWRNDALIWILGYYYQFSPTRTAIAGSSNLNRTFGGVGTPNLGPISATAMTVGGHQLESAYFGQFTADLGIFGLRGVHFTAGYRRTETESVAITLPATVSYPSGLVVPGTVQSRSETSGSGPGFTFSLDWRPNDDLLFYVTRRRGYKPGGLNVIPGASAVPGFVPVYQSESVDDTEIGVKYDFRWGDDLRGRINMNVFRDDYSNIQRGVNAITPAGQNIAFTANVAAATIQGFEAEGYLVLGRRWTITGSYSYIQSDYTRWLGSDPLGAAPAGTNIDLSNNPFANAPENKFSLTVQYELPIDERYGVVRASATVFGQDRSWFTDNAQRYIEVYGNDPNIYLGQGQSLTDTLSDPGFVAGNVRLDWDHVMGWQNLDAALYIRNITDETYAYAGAVSYQSLGLAQRIYSQPRMFGVQLTYRFGER